MKEVILLDAGSIDNWIGGIYYIKNIAYSLLLNEKITSQYKLVIFVREKYLNVYSCFDNIKIETLKTNASIFEKVYKKIELLLKYKIKYIYNYSDVNWMGLGKRKAIYWIPDFQNNYYPDFFSKEENEVKQKANRMILGANTKLVLSSNQAKSDAYQFYDKINAQIKVVHFVSYILPELEKITDEHSRLILNKYQLKAGKYIYIANQFWKHKNHVIVFEAIKLLLGMGKLEDVEFVFTGAPDTRKDIEYSRLIQKYFDDTELSGHVKNLGFIDRAEQLIVMKYADFMIQPSLFEGWGTVLEDAKVLDKTMLLSDIPVHLEQKNDKCIIFHRDNAQDLAEKIEEIYSMEKIENQQDGISRMKKEAYEYSKQLEELFGS